MINILLWLLLMVVICNYIIDLLHKHCKNYVKF